MADTRRPDEPLADDAVVAADEAVAHTEVAQEISRRRGLTALSRAQTIGLFYLLFACFLLWRVVPAVPSEEMALAFGLGDLAPVLPLNAQTGVLGMAVAVLLGGVAGLAEPRLRRYATVALLVVTALFVPLVLVLSLAFSGSSSMNVLPLLGESLRLATPIALGALAGLWCERAGVVNIGIEGMMLAGAGVGFVAYALLGVGGGLPLYVAVLVAVVVGGVMAAIHAVLSVTFRTDQIVSGVAINLLAIGITSFLRREVLLPLNLGGATTLPILDLPLLHRLPVIGGTLFTGKPIFFTMFLVFVATQVTLFRSAWGLRVRAVGENPHAAETLGIDVIRTRYQAVILGGLIAGLGGAWFSLETVGTFDDLMTNGKGFIALAALIFGKWRPWPAFGGALLFGFAEALGRRIQLLGVEVGGFPVPSQFLQILPFVVTIVVLAGAIGRAIPPASVGIPYARSR